MSQDSGQCRMDVFSRAVGPVCVTREMRLLGCFSQRCQEVYGFEGLEAADNRFGIEVAPSKV